MDGEEVTWLAKLHQLLDEQAFPDIIKWVEDGRAFQITNRHTFLATVMPLIGKLVQHQSFVRKLFRHGFAYVSAQFETFGHPSFQKGKPQLLHGVFTSWKQHACRAYLDSEVCAINQLAGADGGLDGQVRE